jgi:hypothetical protein
MSYTSSPWPHWWPLGGPLFLVLWVAGCSSVDPERVSLVERQVRDLQVAVSRLKNETENELRRLGRQDDSEAARIQALQDQMTYLSRKTGTFCVITRNGKWDRFRPAGDSECHFK